jgi:MGT family glycosyltransferase
VARDHVIPSLVASEADVILCDAKIVAACGDLIRRTCPAELIALRTELPIGDALDCPELVLCPAELEIPHFRMAVQGRIYCEPSVADGGVRRATPAHTADERLVYCSLGTQAASYPDAPRVLRAVVDAFGGRAGHRLVMVAGALASHEVLKDVPANVIVERVVDQMAVLREASLTILHGGLGGVKEAIWCGVPMVLVPFAFDQRPNADRVSFHGLGETCLPDDCDAHTLWACACRQFDSANRAAIDTMRQTFRMAEHAEPAARFVLDVLARRAHGAVRC